MNNVEQRDETKLGHITDIAPGHDKQEMIEIIISENDDNDGRPLTRASIKTLKIP